MNRLLEFTPADETEVVHRTLLQVHAAIDEHFPHAAATSKRFSKTVLSDTAPDRHEDLINTPHPEIPVTKEKASLRKTSMKPPEEEEDDSRFVRSSPEVSLDYHSKFESSYNTVDHLHDKDKPMSHQFSTMADMKTMRYRRSVRWLRIIILLVFLVLAAGAATVWFLGVDNVLHWISQQQSSLDETSILDSESED